jgi:uncharacterized protein YegP (UPF0339 family)
MRGRIEYYHDKDGMIRSRVVAENGNILLISSEGYHNLDDCRATTENVVSGKYAEAVRNSYLLYENDETPTRLSASTEAYDMKVSIDSKPTTAETGVIPETMAPGVAAVTKPVVDPVDQPEFAPSFQSEKVAPGDGPVEGDTLTTDPTV